MRADDADGVWTVTFDRPEAKNTFATDVAREPSAALEEPTPKAFDAAMITSDGDAFSAGGDIQAMVERDETVREAYGRARGTLGHVAEAILTAPVPAVARVNGDAVGVGTSVVAACDFAYATHNARFGASFVNVGFVPDAGATVTLPRLVGLRVAKELAFAGKLVSAERAAELDLVNEAAAAAGLDATVDETVETLAAQSTETLALAKETIHASLSRSWADGLKREAHAQTPAHDTDAHGEGVATFLEKRRPEFE